MSALQNLNSYPEIVSLSTSVSCNAMNWPGDAAISFYTYTSPLTYAVNMSAFVKLQLADFRGFSAKFLNEKLLLNVTFIGQRTDTVDKQAFKAGNLLADCVRKKRIPCSVVWLY